MKAHTEYGDQELRAPMHLALHPFRPGDWVNLKTWNAGSLQSQLTPKGNAPHLGS